MADPVNHLRSGSGAASLDQIPGVSADDIAFLGRVWTDLRTAEAARPLSPDEINEWMYAALRTRTDGGDDTGAQDYELALALVRQHTQMQSPDEPHWVWLSPIPHPARWRIYLSPAPGQASALFSALHARLGGILQNVGIKFGSSYKDVRDFRDGWVIYANVAGARPALIAVNAEAHAHPEYFGRQRARFTRPVAGGIAAGLAPDTQSGAKHWGDPATSWVQNNRDWLNDQKREWNPDRTQMSYTQFLAAALTSCYLLAEPPRVLPTRVRGAQQTQWAADALENARLRYVGNVVAAFNDLAINPDGPSVGPATAAGVGWLRYWLFPPTNA